MTHRSPPPEWNFASLIGGRLECLSPISEERRDELDAMPIDSLDDLVANIGDRLRRVGFAVDGNVVSFQDKSARLAFEGDDASKMTEFRALVISMEIAAFLVHELKSEAMTVSEVAN